MMRCNKTLGALALFFAAVGCEQDKDVTQRIPLDDSPVFMDFPVSPNARNAVQSKYAVFSAEYITSGESDQVGRTVFFKDVGDKKLTADFVPGASLDNTDAVSYYIDEKRPSGELSVGVSSAAFARAMTTWDEVTCSEIGMYQVPSGRRVTTGFISALLGYSGSMDYVADIVHAGWMEADFFDMLAPEGSTFILAATFTLVFTDENGNPTDMNNDGRLDVAWREIYYNDAFSWSDGARYDVETIALHEAGHGLSQGHFGSAFLDGGSGALHFSPRAVMNAAYSGIQTEITETDNSGHCANWSSWNAQ